MATNVFLLWRRRANFDPEPVKVAARLQRIFHPIFGDDAPVLTRRNATAGLVCLDLRPRHWREESLQESGSRWCLAPEFPMTAPGLAARLGKRAEGDAGSLLAVDRHIRDGGVEELLEVLAPFSLVSGDDDAGTVSVQIDGLGAAQVFEHDRRTSWALSNRLFAFAALDIPLKPVAEEWAARWALDFFPLETSGFRNIRVLSAGERITVGPKGIRRRRVDTFKRLIAPFDGTRAANAEIARLGLIQAVRDAAPGFKEATLLLSGGWDSRAICSTLLTAGVPFNAQVGGHANNPDVIVAHELARISGFPLVHAGSSHPSTDLGRTRTSIRNALLWESGCRLTKKHKFFARDGGGLGAGRVKITGKHGEIATAGFSRRLHLGGSRQEVEDGFVRNRMSRLGRNVRQRVRAGVEDLIRHEFRALDRYDVPGGELMNLYYLVHRTRRMSIHSAGSKSGLLLTPFFATEYVRASRAFEAAELQQKPIHRHVLAANAPEWSEVPFAPEIERVAEIRDLRAAGTQIPTEAEDAASPEWVNTGITGTKYDNALYWETDGAALAGEALATDGFWSEIYKREAAARRWRRNADEIVISAALSEVIDSISA